MKVLKRLKEGIDTLTKKTGEIRTNNKGNMMNFAIMSVITFIVVSYMLQLTPTMLGAVISATPTQTGAMAGMQGNVTNNIAAGGTLMSTADLVIPIVMVLGLLLIGFGVVVHKS
jgi:cytochrome b